MADGVDSLDQVATPQPATGHPTDMLVVISQPLTKASLCGTSSTCVASSLPCSASRLDGSRVCIYVSTLLSSHRIQRYALDRATAYTIPEPVRITWVWLAVTFHLKPKNAWPGEGSGPRTPFRSALPPRLRLLMSIMYVQWLGGLTTACSRRPYDIQ